MAQSHRCVLFSKNDLISSRVVSAAHPFLFSRTTLFLQKAETQWKLHLIHQVAFPYLFWCLLTK